MHDSNLIPLFDPSTLQKLLTALRKVGTNPARVFETEKINKASHCNVLTALARLLAAREGYGFIHFKDGQILLSTHKETEQGTFRIHIGKLIVQLVKNEFTDKDKLALYRACFKEVIKAHTLRYKRELYTIESFRKFVADKEDWEDTSLAEIAQLTKETENFLKANIHNEKYAIACVQLLLRLDDIDTICNTLKIPEYDRIRTSILEEKFFERFKSDEGLHCELAAIVRDSQTIGLKNLIPKIHASAKNKDFTGSQFCCHLCYLAFESFKDCHPDSQNINFLRYLGNSGIIYPKYQSPFIEKDEFSVKVAACIKFKMESLIRAIEDKNYKIYSLGTNPIENHQRVADAYDHYEKSLESPSTGGLRLT